MSDIYHFVTFLVLLFLSGFFSGSETALVAMSKFRIRKSVQERGEKARRLMYWQDNPEKVLITILIGNNLVNVGAAALATYLALKLAWNPDVGVVVATGVVTLVIITFGEIVPKTVARRNAEGISLKVIQVLRILCRVLAPVVAVFNWIARGAAFVFGDRSADESRVISRREIRLLVGAGEDEGALDRDERSMIEGTLDLRRTTVKEVMTPRVNMVCLETGTPLQEALKMASEAGYSRMPVRGESGEIEGILYVKDLLPYCQGRDPAIAVDELMRPAYFIPEVSGIIDLLRTFRENRIHLAIAIDEYGDASGLVTLEDVLEEVVGRIYDEHDREEGDVRRSDDGSYIVRGTAKVDLLRDEIGIEIPEGDYETIAGFICTSLGRIPKRGETVEIEDWLLEVRKADERRVIEVRAQAKPRD